MREIHMSEWKLDLSGLSRMIPSSCTLCLSSSRHGLPGLLRSCLRWIPPAARRTSRTLYCERIRLPRLCGPGEPRLAMDGGLQDRPCLGVPFPVPHLLQILQADAEKEPVPTPYPFCMWHEGRRGSDDLNLSVSSRSGPGLRTHLSGSLVKILYLPARHVLAELILLDAGGLCSPSLLSAQEAAAPLCASRQGPLHVDRGACSTHLIRSTGMFSYILPLTFSSFSFMYSLSSRLGLIDPFKTAGSKAFVVRRSRALSCWHRFGI